MKQSNIKNNNMEGNRNKSFLNNHILKGINILVLFSLLILYSCDRDEVFEKEQYKNVFALISESNNISHKFHLLGGESVGYVAASLGGTNPTTENIEITLVEDESFIDKFNKTNYDVDKTKYAHKMPKENYDIDSYEFTIPAGEISGRLPIRIRPDGLSPDHQYMIALRVESHSAYEVNPEKSYILYSVRTKNYWAEADGTSIYSMNGKLGERGQTYELQMPGTKVMHPISKNQVRIMAGNEKYEAGNINTFNKLAIILTVDENNKVTISPYRDIEVYQIDGDPFYSNTFIVEDDGFKTFKTFRLRYDYKSDNKIYEFKEELRLQFNEEEEKNQTN
ncbi:MAG: DUF1735 domain-containing protein [Dysgonamonadaceae bacterium]|jgi:hypothetical protein|nr:DUF1735 domain-containing protein [Dysgonamonadaceae bacterium]MDD3309369.1 DUF1735 domain-containing protein [Dysgonamonadaceae bacterium]MDD3900374.1 DUF1735 domain-containing protein [Dysgonamonadaceae bacterium]MDD4399008.1 DUF1735 domain-containing protein [Dysgonamonadaceae bacterium]MEA5081665.1 DUF1735 domain-containing protein [Dysgonamonadaceae bacterium]